MDVIYELFGYLNLFPEVPGFMYPVFYKDGSFYLADGDILYIKSFHPLKAEYISIVTPISKFSTASYFNIIYSIGSFYPHIYQKESGEIYIGSGTYLYKQFLNYQLNDLIL